MAGLAVIGFACLALLPAAANPSLMVRGETLSTFLCAGAGRVRVEIPLGDPIMPGTLASACCVKGCQRDKRRTSGQDGASGDGDNGDNEGEREGEGEDYPPPR